MQSESGGSTTHATIFLFFLFTIDVGGMPFMLLYHDFLQQGQRGVVGARRRSDFQRPLYGTGLIRQLS